jgi:pimeloyl-ACP methyl ester carboxylesterase
VLVAPRRLDLGGDRVLGYDDVGDPDGTPVVYLHGTPDSRLARHPDDGVAAGLGIRLLAVDRPGFGDSSRRRSPGSLAADLAVLLDDLGLARAALLGWSSGGLAALTAAAPLGPRCDRLVLVGTLPPVEAYRDEALLAALGPGRRGFAELALDLAPSEAAAEVAPYVVPLPLTPDLARDHVLEGAGEAGRRELAAVRGALEQMVEALLHGVGEGAIGLEDDLLDQLEPGLDLGAVACPVRLVHGELDEVSPPAVGHWLAARLPDATVEIVPDAAHHLLFPEWEHLLGLAGGR